MIYTPAIRPFLKERLASIDVLEIEPQTLWLADDAIHGPYREHAELIDAFAALPVAKLVHSVGMPLGGTRPPSPSQVALIRATAERLDSAWVSEHLSVAGTPHRSAGFLLPPLQTDEGVATAAANIRALADGVGRPVAVETGVSYIRRKPFEMADGDFVAAVCEASGCGILLDLHNIYCNERNGRTTIDGFVGRLPLDRVWEVHLAGGMESEGFWLDAHNGPMQRDLAARARQIVRALPNLGALNFEIYETFLDRLGPAVLDEILDELRDIWSEAGRATGDGDPRIETPQNDLDTGAVPGPGAWEEALTEAVRLDRPELHPFPDDAPAIRLYARLARSFRGSMLLRVLPRGMRYLILSESDQGDQLLAGFFAAEPPRLYAQLEARAFRDWVEQEGVGDALLVALLDYDIALLEMTTDPAPRTIAFPGDPRSVFEALEEGRLPPVPAPPAWEIEILPDLEQLLASRVFSNQSGS